jgi:two-component system, NtrC family, nitrogen regulation sensor histidine kinase NtrY
MSTHERQIWRFALLVPAPALVLALWLLVHSSLSRGMQWTLVLALGGATVTLAVALQQRVSRPLRLLSNMLAAIREQDYSMRARNPDPSDALGLTMLELNTLMDELKARRLGALEANSLLRRVMSEIDIAIFAFDDADVLCVINGAGERLLAHIEAPLLGRTATELGLSACLSGDVPRSSELVIAGQRARWEVRRGSFRQEGRPHQFVLLSDLSRTLRAEERIAWERLVRVLGHEINNSLTPIASLSERLHELLNRVPDGERVPEELREHLTDGLQLISTRSGGLSRFMSSYTRLLRLPPPRLAEVELLLLLERVVALDTRVPILVHAHPPIVLTGDADQLEQMLINLIRNAVDASVERGGGVQISVELQAASVVIAIVDDGAGLPDTANLFVPFFTTKPSGSGIGLVLSRQIAEVHGGTVTLANRENASGCIATVTLPLPQR